MGLDWNMDTQEERYISRPLCSNQMRKANKIALKVESFVNFTAVMTRDIVTDATGVILLTGNIIDKANKFRLQNKCRAEFKKLVESCSQSEQFETL